MATAAVAATLIEVIKGGSQLTSLHYSSLSVSSVRTMCQVLLICKDEKMVVVFVMKELMNVKKKYIYF